MQNFLKSGLVFWAQLLAASSVHAQLTIEVVPPADTRLPVYIAGTFNNWNPGDPRYRLANNRITLPDSVRGPIEFKFTLGSWQRVETSIDGSDVANRTFTIPNAGIVIHHAVVAAWRDSAAVTTVPHRRSSSVIIMDSAFAMPQLARRRRIWLYLPPDYATSKKRYPVLYLHDGQNVFDAATSFAGEWGVDEALDTLPERAIVVAIDNGGAERMNEYSPWTNPRYGGGRGEAYVRFIAKTLKPYIDSHYRTLTAARHTVIGGSSMGGLISLYAALKYPKTFGAALVFSPAFWFAPELFEFARMAKPHGQRFYFVVGAREGTEPERYAGDQQKMIETLRRGGFKDIDAIVRADGMHAEWFWRREFPAAYERLFRPRR